MSEVIGEDAQEFIKNVFQEDNDPFLTRSWYSLDERFEYVPARMRRYQIAWQAAVGVLFLRSLNIPRAICAEDQLLAVVKEYDAAQYYSLLKSYSHEVVRRDDVVECSSSVFF